MATSFGRAAISVGEDPVSSQITAAPVTKSAASAQEAEILAHHEVERGGEDHKVAEDQKDAKGFLRGSANS
ncbi:hypothetical protein [Defluviimonas salinarum]|uniref:Uncharacterized protein n=1 Tax=Defluviimonas salinarum TaxID=2992147 RepID=A0ABT3IXT3_9RHOB|nr:hypothetical protein [Defluviimonas salinarum]MCW3780244.1 hypothetical protein [Defluviimonas salinarum]